MLDALLRDVSDMLAEWDEQFLMGLSRLRHKRLSLKQRQKLQQLYAATGAD